MFLTKKKCDDFTFIKEESVSDESETSDFLILEDHEDHKSNLSNDWQNNSNSESEPDLEKSEDGLVVKC